jgi:formiminotetrahydrofolate cyclodeaminase
MKVNHVSMTVADFCAAFKRKEVVVDTNYQRNSEVWPDRARSYLIETILKGFPIPKLTLHQRTDLRSKKTIKYVVDGQQRSKAMLDFYENNLTLTRTLDTADARGKSYEGLNEELQQIFLSYPLDFDQFEAASEDDVREYFRRINSFTAPLTAEEQRHARFQGEMKWFIHELASKYESPLVNLGVLTKKSAIRMADAKLLAEMVSALLLGVTTTSKTSLDRMYAEYDKKFDESDAIRDALVDGLDYVIALAGLRSTSLLKPHMFYSLVLARVAVRGWPTLSSLAPANPAPVRDAENRLLHLADALDDPDGHPAEREFILASSEKTNVKSQREARVRRLGVALAG